MQDLEKYFNGEIDFHTKLHSIAKEAMIKAYENKSIEEITQWGNIMSQENTIVLTLENCKRAILKEQLK